MDHERKAPTTFARPEHPAPLPLAAAVACSLGALLAFPGEAHAESEVLLGIDLNHNDVQNLGNAGRGTSFDLLLGLRSTGTFLTNGLELTYGFHDFGGVLDPEVSRLLVGGSFGLDWIVRPSIFGRIGVGYLSVDGPLDGGRTAGTHLAGETGLALDFRVLPQVDVGVQASYDWVQFTDSFEWWQAGAHLTFVFPY
jgi:hypothetical protein